MNQQISPAPHLVLVGLMGIGKSTVGRRLAHKLGWEFLDTDDEINRFTGQSVRQIFESDGEERFRQIEHDVLAVAWSAPTPHVIAAAGGIVLRADNREILKTAQHVVWLNAPLHVLLQRIGQRASKAEGHRPLLDTSPAEKLQEMYITRESLYQEVATHEINVEGLLIEEVIDKILSSIGLEAAS
jgi:shikimate kinase